MPFEKFDQNLPRHLITWTTRIKTLPFKFFEHRFSTNPFLIFKQIKSKLIMQERIYLDSNILISILKEEIGANHRLLAEEAKEFLNYVRKNNSTIIISNLFFQEVKKIMHIEKENIIEYFNSIKINFEEANENLATQEITESKKFETSEIHYPDSLHLLIALKNNCNCIVTFNKKDFEKANHLIEIKEPIDFDFI